MPAKRDYNANHSQAGERALPCGRGVCLPAAAPAAGRTPFPRGRAAREKTNLEGRNMSRIYTSADQLVGRTPLLELTHLEQL